VTTADAIVIGGGVMGTAAARSLGDLGRETILFEQFEIGHARGSSHGPTRVFRLAYPQPDYVRLAQRALASWQRLEDAAGETLLVRTGGLYAGAWAEECGDALTACGVPRAWLPAAEAAERFPAISFDGIERVLLQEDGGVCLADRTVAAQARLARAAGVDVRESCEVEHVLLGDEGIVVVTADGEVAAPVAVIAAGPWAGWLLSELAIELPLRPAFAQVSYFAPRSGEAPEGLPTFIEADVLAGGLGSGGYWIPPVTEGAVEVKAGDGTPGATVDPAAAPFPVDPARAAADGAWVARRLPGYDPEPVRSDTCIYTMTPDEDFVLERLGPAVVCSPCSGHGFKFAPLLGELVAELAVGGRPALPSGRFSATRAALLAG
jgi:sarcosine oxidase